MVRARCHHIVEEADNLAISGADKGRCLVAILELLGTLTRSISIELTTYNSLGVDRYEEVETVASVDVEQLAHRAESVSRIWVSSEDTHTLHSPTRVGLAKQSVEAVSITARSVKHLTKEALLRHIEYGHLVVVVDAVLGHHTVATSALCSIDQSPKLVDGHCRRHLNSHVFATLHSIDRHLDVSHPRSRDVDDVDVITLADSLPSIIRACVLDSRVTTCILEVTLHQIETRLLQVADGYDVGVLDLSPTLWSGSSSVSQTDEAYANNSNRLGSKEQHILLSCGTLRCLEHNAAIHHFVGLSTIATYAHKEQGEDKREKDSFKFHSTI